MYHKVRITVVSLVVMMVCVLSSSGTLSYFTDTDTKTNSFVVGNASTELKLYSDDTLVDDDHLFSTAGLVLTDNSDIDVYPQATNDGNIPVYQRFRVVIPIALKGVVTLNLPSMNDGCTISAADAATVTEKTCEDTNYTVAYKSAVKVGTEDKYAEYYITSKAPLGTETTNNQTAKWPILGLHIGELSSVDDSSSIICENGDKNNCELTINIYSDAIQTAGFTGGAVSAFVNHPETYNN